MGFAGNWRVRDPRGHRATVVRGAWLVSALTAAALVSPLPAAAVAPAAPTATEGSSETSGGRTVGGRPWIVLLAPKALVPDGEQPRLPTGHLCRPLGRTQSRLGQRPCHQPAVAPRWIRRHCPVRLGGAGLRGQADIGTGARHCGTTRQSRASSRTCPWRSRPTGAARHPPGARGRRRDPGTSRHGHRRRGHRHRHRARRRTDRVSAPSWTSRAARTAVAAAAADTNDGHGHGTHVAGIIGARDNGVGVAGVAPGARLWAVRVFDSEGRGTTSTVICGIDWVTEWVATHPTPAHRRQHEPPGHRRLRWPDRLRCRRSGHPRPGAPGHLHRDRGRRRVRGRRRQRARRHRRTTSPPGTTRSSPSPPLSDFDGLPGGRSSPAEVSGCARPRALTATTPSRATATSATRSISWPRVPASGRSHRAPGRASRRRS